MSRPSAQTAVARLCALPSPGHALQIRRDPDGAHSSTHLPRLLSFPCFASPVLSFSPKYGLSLPDLLQPVDPQVLWSLTSACCLLLLSHSRDVLSALLLVCTVAVVLNWPPASDSSCV